MNTAVCKVLDHGTTIVANGAEVERLPTGVQSQDHIELLDQQRRGLMNGADDAMACPC